MRPDFAAWIANSVESPLPLIVRDVPLATDSGSWRWIVAREWSLVGSPWGFADNAVARGKWRTFHRCVHDSRDEMTGRAMCAIRDEVGPGAFVWINRGWEHNHGEAILHITRLSDKPQEYWPIPWTAATHDERKAVVLAAAVR